jgi:hypothetical protein
MEVAKEEHRTPIFVQRTSLQQDHLSEVDHIEAKLRAFFRRLDADMNIDPISKTLARDAFEVAIMRTRRSITRHDHL